MKITSTLVLVVALVSSQAGWASGISCHFWDDAAQVEILSLRSQWTGSGRLDLSSAPVRALVENADDYPPFPLGIRSERVGQSLTPMMIDIFLSTDLAQYPDLQLVWNAGERQATLVNPSEQELKLDCTLVR